MNFFSLAIMLSVISVKSGKANDSLYVFFNSSDSRQTRVTPENLKEGVDKIKMKDKCTCRDYLFYTEFNQEEAEKIKYKIIFSAKKIDKAKNQKKCCIKIDRSKIQNFVYLADLRTISDFESLRLQMFQKTVILIDESESGYNYYIARNVVPVFLLPLKNIKTGF